MSQENNNTHLDAVREGMSLEVLASNNQVIFLDGFWEKMENRSEASFFVTVQEEKYGRTFDCDCG